MRSLTDEFVKRGTGNWERGTGNGRVALLRDREEWGMGRFVPVALGRVALLRDRNDPPMGPLGWEEAHRGEI